MPKQKDKFRHSNSHIKQSIGVRVAVLAHILHEGKFLFTTERDLFVFYKTVLSIELYQEQFPDAIRLFKPMLERLLPTHFLKHDFLGYLVEDKSANILRDTFILKISPRDVGEFHDIFFNHQEKQNVC